MNYYNKVYGLKAVSLRYGNVYGPRQDPFGEAGVVAIFTNRMLEDKEVYIFGDGKQMRDFVYVSDVVEANVKCMLKDFEFEIYNVGTQKATSVNELFKILSKLTGYKKQPIYQPARKGELFKSYLSIYKIKKQLSWKPKVSLEEGLKKTLDYFKNK
jgi:UDP-glucose 4-epimerase